VDRDREGSFAGQLRTTPPPLLLPLRLGIQVVESTSVWSLFSRSEVMILFLLMGQALDRNGVEARL
jgi:hypothetical protein